MARMAINWTIKRVSQLSQSPLLSRSCLEPKDQPELLTSLAELQVTIPYQTALNVLCNYVELLGIPGCTLPAEG